MSENLENTQNVQNTENLSNLVQEVVKRSRGRPKGSLNKPTKVVQAILPTNKAKVVKDTKNAPDSIINNKNTNKDALINKLLQTTGCKYNTLDYDTYKGTLDNMPLNDLHDEAMRVGLKPLGDRSLTTSTLLQVFKEEVLKFVPRCGNIGINKIDADKSDKIMELMKVGR